MGGKADAVGKAAQHSQAGRVKCEGPNVLALFAQHSRKPLLKLACGLVCEGYGENFIGAGRVDG